MRMLLRLHTAVFVLALLIPGIVFLCKIWNLLPLYTQPETRDWVKKAMVEVSEREGWLLSDMLVQSVTADEIRLTHRQHIRGTDPERCYVIELDDTSLHPCDAEPN